MCLVLLMIGALTLADRHTVRAQGPIRQDPAPTWSNLGPPGVGDIEAFGVSPDWPNDRFILARERDSDRLFRSYDGGQTWDTVHGFTATSVREIMIATAAAGRHLILAITSVSAGACCAAIFRSVDEGQSWTNTPVAAWSEHGPKLRLSADVFRLSPAFSQDGIVLALTGGQLYWSSDAGATWDARSAPDGQRFQQVEPSPDFEHDRTVFAAVTAGDFTIPTADVLSITRSSDYETSHGVMRSTDDGRTWLPASSGLEREGVPYRSVQQIAISPAFAEDSTLFAFAWGPAVLGARGYGYDIASHLFRSTDRGVTWAPVPNDTSPERQLHVPSAEPSDLADYVTLSLSPGFLHDGLAMVTLSSTFPGPSRSSCAVLWTVDHGATWTWAGEAHPMTYFCDPAVLVGPPDHPVAFSVSRPGTGYPSWLRSLDGGVSWSAIDPPSLVRSADSPIFLARDGTFFSVRKDGIWALSPASNTH